MREEKQIPKAANKHMLERSTCEAQINRPHAVRNVPSFLQCCVTSRKKQLSLNNLHDHEPLCVKQTICMQF